MKLPLLPLLLLLLLLFVAAQAVTEDLASAMFSFPMASIDKCFAAREACRLCRARCEPARYSHLKYSHPSVRVIARLRGCRLQVSNSRTGMDPWCLSDRSGFYATNQFKPSRQTCKIEPITCASMTKIWFQKQVRYNKMNNRHQDVILAYKMADVAKVIQKEIQTRKNYTEQLKKVRKMKQWYRDDILKEMQTHIRSPDNIKNRFADPVFNNLNQVQSKTRKTDLSLYRNDYQSVKIENIFVRQDTVDKIPAILKSIDALQNRITNQRSATSAYLKEIRGSLNSTHKMQMESTNFIFETTHVRSLDGEIVLLDKDLLDLFIRLKDERALLRKASVRSTNIKMRLILAMRSMVREISISQQRNRCGYNKFYNPSA